MRVAAWELAQMATLADTRTDLMWLPVGGPG
jgi:hypothetical protein